MCKKCNKPKCNGKCGTAITPKGKTGPRGPRGPAGPTGPSGVFQQVVGQSASWGGITGAIGTTGVGTTFSNLESNFFVSTPKFFTISVGLNVTSPTVHTITAYFKKNGVQVGATYKRTMQPFDYLSFQTELLQFVAGNYLDLYIESTVAGVEVTPVHLINYRLI